MYSFSFSSHSQAHSHFVSPHIWGGGFLFLFSLPLSTRSFFSISSSLVCQHRRPFYANEASSSSSGTGPQSPWRPQRPPRPPIKAASPRSRVFNVGSNGAVVGGGGRGGPCAVVTASGGAGLSPRYRPERRETYFQQCFDILRELGRGSSAVVYAVRSHDNGRLYAVKQALQAVRGEADLERRLEEIRTAQELGNHPHCIRYVAAWHQEGVLFIQTELCEAGSLRDYLDRHGSAVPEDTLWRFLTDTALGLAHVHSRQLLHLDIKPANIFITRNAATLKLGDFGLAGRLGSGQRLQEGDPVYLAPELLAWDEGGFGQAADVFSLGMTILACGSAYELPSRGQRWQELRTGRIPDVLTRNLSQEMVSLISAMISPEPEQRPTVYQVLSHPQVARIVQSRRKNRLAALIARVIRPVVALLLLMWSLILHALSALVVRVRASVLGKLAHSDDNSNNITGSVCGGRGSGSGAGKGSSSSRGMCPSSRGAGVNEDVVGAGPDKVGGHSSGHSSNERVGGSEGGSKGRSEAAGSISSTTAATTTTTTTTTTTGIDGIEPFDPQSSKFASSNNSYNTPDLESDTESPSMDRSWRPLYFEEGDSAVAVRGSFSVRRRLNQLSEKRLGGVGVGGSGVGGEDTTPKNLSSMFERAAGVETTTPSPPPRRRDTL